MINLGWRPTPDNGYIFSTLMLMCSTWCFSAVGVGLPRCWGSPDLMVDGLVRRQVHLHTTPPHFAWQMVHQPLILVPVTTAYNAPSHSHFLCISALSLPNTRRKWRGNVERGCLGAEGSGKAGNRVKDFNNTFHLASPWNSALAPSPSFPFNFMTHC